MKPTVSRRHLLLGAGTLLGLTGSSRGVRGARGSTASGRFRPTVHGFGFRNWSPQSQYFDPPPMRSRRQIRGRLEADWSSTTNDVLGGRAAQLSDPLLDAIAFQLRLAIGQRAGTNGHCYGMVLTAQRYFEEPASIPVDRRVASEIDDPTVPIDDPSAPVYEEILQRQANQFLNFRAWLGRRAMAYPEWIDTRKVLDDVRSVIEAFGTATLSLFDESLFGHQVLAYGFDEHDDGVTIPIYDPNRKAVAYSGSTPELRFDEAGGELSMQPYGQYTGVLFNQYDQIEHATDRGSASPLDHLTVDRAVVRASIFPLALVVVDVEDVELAVVDPNGETLDRIRGTYMDSARGEYARMRSVYGATPGTYRITVLGTQATSYELTVTVADSTGTLLDSTRSARIDAGESHEYLMELPDDGPGRLGPADTGDEGTGWVGGAAAVGGVAAGAVGYHTYRRLLDGERLR